MIGLVRQQIIFYSIFHFPIVSKLSNYFNLLMVNQTIPKLHQIHKGDHTKNTPNLKQTSHKMPLTSLNLIKATT